MPRRTTLPIGRNSSQVSGDRSARLPLPTAPAIAPFAKESPVGGEGILVEIFGVRIDMGVVLTEGNIR